MLRHCPFISKQLISSWLKQKLLRNILAQSELVCPFYDDEN